MKTLIIHTESKEVHVHANKFTLDGDRLAVYGDGDTVTGHFAGVQSAYFEDTINEDFHEHREEKRAAKKAAKGKKE